MGLSLSLLIPQLGLSLLSSHGPRGPAELVTHAYRAGGKQSGRLQLCLCEKALPFVSYFYSFQFHFVLLPANQCFSLTGRGWLAAGSSQLCVVAAPHAAPLDSWRRRVLAPSTDPDAQRFNTHFPCDSGRFRSSLGPDCRCWLRLAWQCRSGAISSINNPLVKGHQEASRAHVFATLCCYMRESGAIKRVRSCLSGEKTQPSNRDAVLLQYSPRNLKFILSPGVSSPINNLK